jgi:thiamine biosynthesis lipoprotein
MRKVAMIMGMPITIEVPGITTDAPIEAAFAYFRSVDARFSPFKPDSEVSAMNRGEIAEDAQSAEMREVLSLAENTRWDTRGYFNVRRPDGSRCQRICRLLCRGRRRHAVFRL